MLQLQNNTPFAADIAVFPNEDGVDTLYTTVKATFNLDAQWSLADQQLPVLKEDCYRGDPSESSLRWPSDIHVGKKGTDIVIDGSAVTVDGKPRSFVDVSATVGPLAQTARVFGDRYWRRGQITLPEPFQEIPLIYERAFGGTLSDGEALEADPRNPVGQFYFGKSQKRSAEGTSLPNIEDPRALIAQPGDTPAPIGFGPMAPHWYPRSHYAGTYGEEWETERAPFLPHDFDKRFCNVASSGLVYPGWICGGEPVHIRGMSYDPLKFNVPVVKICNKIMVAGGQERPPAEIETMIVIPRERKLVLVWRSSLRVSKNKLKVNSVTLSLSR